MTYLEQASGVQDVAIALSVSEKWRLVFFDCFLFGEHNELAIEVCLVTSPKNLVSAKIVLSELFDIFF